MDRRILALDLARKSAAAWRLDDGTIRTVPFALGKEGAAHVPSHLVRLDQELTALIALSGCDTVSIETDTGRGAGTTTLRSYQAVARLVASKNGCEILYRLCAVSARKAVLNHGYHSKDDVRAAVGDLKRFDASGMDDDEVDSAILLIASEAWYVATDLIEGSKAMAAARAAERQAAAKAAIKPSTMQWKKDARNRRARGAMSYHMVEPAFDRGADGATEAVPFQGARVGPRASVAP